MAKKNNSAFFNLFEAEQYSEGEDSTISSAETVTEGNKNYVSIAQMEDYEEPEVSEPKGAQTTMFENEAFNNFFFNEKMLEATDESIDNEFSEELADELTVEPLKNVEILDSIDDIQENISKQSIAFDDNEAIHSVDENTNGIAESIEINDIEIKNIDVLSENAVSNKTEIADVGVNEFVVEPVITENTPASVQDDEENLISMLETNPLDEEITEDTLQAEKTDIFKNIMTYEEIKNKDIFDNFETPYLFHGKKGDRIRYRLEIPSENKPKRNRFKRSAMSWIITISVAFILAILLRTFVFVIATVDGPSMLPTLENNEKLFVTKFTYAFTDIQRGDVVICKYGTETYPDIYVKRVIGLSGEMISIVDGVVYINGTELEEKYILEPMVNDMNPVYIPEGYVFVMGDNRNNSADSRKVGYLKKDLIIGKAQFIISPINKIGSLEANP